MGGAALLVRKWFDRHGKAVARMLEGIVPRAIPFWIAGLCVVIAAKVLGADRLPSHGAEYAAMILPFLLAAAAPILAYRVATAAFPRSEILAQPAIRLCRYGNWRSLDPLSARRHPAFGPEGLMASLAAGLLLNVPLRTMEFMAAIPAIPTGAPRWAMTILGMMTLDLVTMSFLYMTCFVLALRAAPWFPRLLVLTWTTDVFLQLAIAQQVAMQPGLPGSVAGALVGLLTGNIRKVLISVALWLPYLILSQRVNVTYRQRIRC